MSALLTACSDPGLVAIDPDAPDPADTGALDEREPTPEDAGPFECTLVIGYSQVGLPLGGWFHAGGAFEYAVEDGRWELLWNGGGGVDLWQDAAYEGWQNAIESPCSGGVEPDRVLLSVSGPYGDDVPAWVEAIEVTVEQIRVQVPGARQIILQPVVGGPDEQPCPYTVDEDVRASWQHPYIDAAIAQVVGGDVVAGASPTVRSCADYLDDRGHLTPAGAQAIGTELGAFYAAL